MKLVISRLLKTGYLESARRSIMDRRTEKRGAYRQPPEVEAKPEGRRAFLIRIAADSDQERALVAFRGVRDAVHSIAEDKFLVAGEHVEALRNAGVPFEDLTESPVKHGKAAAG
jgi:hypothetical protein